MIYTVLRDNQEKVGYWEFPNTESIHLKTGDYTIKGYEDKLCIERKKTANELAINCHEKRFVRELERMSLFKYKFIIMEFSIDDILRFPEGSAIPRSKWPELKVTGKYIFKFIMESSVHYGINILFCGDRENAMLAAEKIMNRVMIEEK